MRPLLIIKAGDTLPEIAARRGDYDIWIRDGLGLGALPVDTVCVHRDEVLPPADAVAGVVVTPVSVPVTEYMFMLLYDGS